MASSYALPTAGTTRYGKGHQAFPSLNGLISTENSPETTFIADQHDTQAENQDSFNVNASLHNGHTHSHSRSHSQKLPMKGRIRGESDLSRPMNGHAHSHNHDHVSHGSGSSWFSLPEALTGFLLPIPYLLASIAYSSSTTSDATFPPLSAYARLQGMVSGADRLEQESVHRSSSFVQACTLTSGTLLIVGILAQIQQAERVLDRRKGSSTALQDKTAGLLTGRAVVKMVRSALSVGLPYYAAMQLGGVRAGLMLLNAAASGLMGSDYNRHSNSWMQIFSSQRAICFSLLLCIVSDFSGLTISMSSFDLTLGYLALMTSIFWIQPPLPTSIPCSTGPSSASMSQSTTRERSAKLASFSSPLTASAFDSLTTLVAGFLLAFLAIAAATFLSSAPPISMSAIGLYIVSLVSASALVFFARPSALCTYHKTGLISGCLFLAASSVFFSPSIWPGTVANGALSALVCFAILYDTPVAPTKRLHDDHDHSHAHTEHSHHHHHDHASHAPQTHVRTPTDVSFLTAFLLSFARPGTLMHGILCEKDSRRIAYFTCLNFGFMLVQAFYGWVSGSLGLLSDTVHMFFDCLALIVGLGAAVASKWPTSPEKPYGWGKLNTLAGFGNGIFLMLVSVEFVWEALEGIMEGKELRRVQELLVVSTLGFVVNLIGLLAFGHAHAGHDHGHGGHDHGHSHEAHDHDHDHSSHSHNHTDISGAHDHTSLHVGPVHKHENENMHGIYLHIAADAGGSLAVILSTSLTLYYPWYLWDPLATILIAILIFMAAVPLVRTSARKLLLVIPDELEWGLKNALQELVMLRGITGYAVPRFWVEDGEGGDAHGHDHHHGHSHDHGDQKKEQRVLGVIHVFASRAANVDDVKDRTVQFFADRNMEVVVQVEREGEGRCWCGGGAKMG